MADPQHFNPPVPTSRIEKAARLETWTLGGEVRLSNGESWWLPRIDWPLLLFRPDLVASISRTFDSACEITRVESNAEQHSIASAVYHSQLALLGVDLLQLNYDRTDEDWRHLLSFARIPEMLNMTSAISDAIADSVSAWMPFHLTRGPSGAESLLAN